MECEHATSLTARVVKATLPDRAIVTRDAKQTLNTSASMFTLYLAATAHEHSVQQKRQTMTLKDVLQALREMDFEQFVGPVEDCVREMKSSAARKKATKYAQNDMKAADGEEMLIDSNAVADLDEDNMEEPMDEGMESVEGQSGVDTEEDEEVAEAEAEADDTDGAAAMAEGKADADTMQQQHSQSSDDKTAKDEFQDGDKERKPTTS